MFYNMNETCSPPSVKIFLVGEPKRIKSTSEVHDNFNVLEIRGKEIELLLAQLVQADNTADEAEAL